MAGNNGGFDAGDGDSFGGVVGGENRNPLMADSPSSTHLLRPKKPKKMYDRNYQLIRQQAEGEPKRKNASLQSKPTPFTQWLWGSREDDYRPASVHSGGSAAQFPFFPWSLADVVNLSRTRGAGLRFPRKSASRWRRGLVRRAARFLRRRLVDQNRHAGGLEP